ncbi:MAG: polysaccharide export protein [Candidatus Omnitrophica bacterium]|nr:polysaccharide export protein [Candidatus Omnitrophota bacterium]
MRWFILVTCLLFGTPLAAQSEIVSKIEQSQPNAWTDPYFLQKGDRLKVVIYPEDPYIQGAEVLVNSEGVIVLPMVGRIEVAGLSLSEAERRIEGILNQSFLVDPDVAIEILEQDSREGDLSVMILGQVNNPGYYDLDTRHREATLMRAISEAGGFSSIANSKRIKISRKLGDKRETLRANAQEILEGKREDLVLQEGDIIHVAESLF